MHRFYSTELLFALLLLVLFYNIDGYRCQSLTKSTPFMVIMKLNFITSVPADI